MSEPANPRDSPNVEPQSLRPAGHDVSSSNTEKEEDHYLVGESSYRDALRQEGTTRPKELSPESGHSHQTRSTGEPLLWHLGPKDKPILDEGFEASTSSEQAERWNRFKNYGNRRSLENVVNPEVPPSASSQLSNTFFTPSPWQVQGPTNPLWPVAGTYQYEQDIFDEDEAPIATDYSTSPDERRPKNPVNPSDESTLTNPILPRLEPTRSPLVTPAHSKSGASNPAKTVKQKKTVSREGEEGKREDTKKKEGLQPSKLTYSSEVESSGEERKQREEKKRTKRSASWSEGSWNRSTDDNQGSDNLEGETSSDSDQNRGTIRKSRTKRKVTRKSKSPSTSPEKSSDEGAAGGAVGKDTSPSPERTSDDGAVGGRVSRDHSIESDQSDQGINPNPNGNNQNMANPPPNSPQAHQRGPNIRLPWFHGKEDEQVEKYFRELKRLKTIYDWTNDHLLNMTLLGLKGRADDWAGALPDQDKDTFDKLETQMVKIFGDRRAKWQKHSEFCSLKQGKDQSVIEFAGGLKQKQIKAEASDSMMLAVFLEGLKQTIARQVAIMDPKTFTEAVDCATRLESLDKGKAGSKISNAVSELGGNDEESGETSLESVNERFGIVLARLEAAPWFQKPRQGQGEPAQTSSGYRQQGYERKAGYDNQKGGRNPDQRPKTGKAQGAQVKGEMGDQPAFKRERQKLTYDESKYCIIHQQHGHATDACLWLKNRLKEKPPRMYKDDRERKGENKEQGN